jgi:hypothetical protein
MVLFDQGTYDKLLVEVPKYKLITPSVLSDRLRVSTHSPFTSPMVCGMAMHLHLMFGDFGNRGLFRVIV